MGSGIIVGCKNCDYYKELLLGVCFRRFEQCKRANDIGLNKRGRAGDRTVDVTLGRRVNHARNAVLLEQLRHEISVGNVPLDKRIAPCIGQILKVAQRPRIRQQIEIDDLCIGFGFEKIAQKITPNEPGPAGH